MKRLPLICSFLLLSSFLFAPSADASVIVTLKNGNTLTANSYRIEKNRIFLKYPVGEVEVLLPRVESLKEEDGTVRMFQAQGERQKDEAPKPSVQQNATGLPAYPFAKSPAPAYTETDKNRLLEKRAEAAAMPKTMGEKKADDFVDKYFAASDEDRAKMDKELDTVLDQLSDDGGETGGKKTDVNKK